MNRLVSTLRMVMVATMASGLMFWLERGHTIPWIIFGGICVGAWAMSKEPEPWE